LTLPSGIDISVPPPPRYVTCMTFLIPFHILSNSVFFVALCLALITSADDTVLLINPQVCVYISFPMKLLCMVEPD
jgi:hypothetical protein